MNVTVVIQWDTATVHAIAGTVEEYQQSHNRSAQLVGIFDVCGYDVHAGWGPQRCPWLLKLGPCPTHARLRCHCGKPALFPCPDASGMLVCGVPGCAEHQYCERHER